ncbi:MAG: histidinol-phosphate aminotransferase family protein [Vicinamibacterales bacterium]
MTHRARPAPGLKIAIATPRDREAIYRARHDVYARELGQHPSGGDGRLADALDDVNLYFTASAGGELLGFISLTPPGGPLSLDKYRPRSDYPFAIDDRTWEVRLLTVLAPHRRRAIAVLLAYAAFRWIAAHGGRRIVAMGRIELLPFYNALGLLSTGLPVSSGAVTFEVLTADIDTLEQQASTAFNLPRMLERSAPHLDWQLPIAFRSPARCFHGGAFFKAIGEDFTHLDRRHEVINADVLDAWFPPAPGVLESLRGHLDWIIRTSPPTDCAGMIRAIALARGVPESSILPGAGSSDLIFLAFGLWLQRTSRALILDPMYGEYAHVLEKVIGCTVERLHLSRDDGYRIDLATLERLLAEPFDVVVIVNPNSPTGVHVPRETLERLLRSSAARRIWLDETYVDYAAPGQSLEHFAAASHNAVVCKSMSKAYALSGARAAYLCGSSALLEDLRAGTPPWAVSLPGQIAAVTALADPAYYLARWSETARLREALARDLRNLARWDVVPGVANFLLCHLPEDGPDAAAIAGACRPHGLYLRDASAMGRSLGRHALRIAVKDAATHTRMLAILGDVLATLGPPSVLQSMA